MVVASHLAMANDAGDRSARDPLWPRTLCQSIASAFCWRSQPRDAAPHLDGLPMQIALSGGILMMIVAAMLLNSIASNPAAAQS